jgi:hypothetical protein
MRKKLTPQLILDDEENGGYNMFDEVRLSEENGSKEKNGCFSVIFRFFCFFRKSPPSF